MICLTNYTQASSGKGGRVFPSKREVERDALEVRRIYELYRQTPAYNNANGVHRDWCNFLRDTARAIHPPGQYDRLKVDLYKDEKK